jgi:hypothetical protein
MIAQVKAQTRILFYPTPNDDKRNPKPSLNHLTDMTMEDGTKIKLMQSSDPHTFELQHPSGSTAVVSVGEMLNAVIEASFNSIET